MATRKSLTRLRLPSIFFVGAAAAAAAAADDSEGSTGTTRSSATSSVRDTAGGSDDALDQKTAAAEPAGAKVQPRAEATTLLAKKSTLKAASDKATKAKATKKKNTDAKSKSSGIDSASKEGRSRRRSDDQSRQNARTEPIPKQSLVGCRNASTGSATVPNVCSDEAEDKIHRAKPKTGESLYPIGTGVAKDFGGIGEILVHVTLIRIVFIRRIYMGF